MSANNLTAVTGKNTKSYARQKAISLTMAYVFLIVLCFIWVIPIVWVVLTSFRVEPGSFTSSFFPQPYSWDNVEIVEQAGEENNYIFGARVEDIDKIKGSYDSRKLYNENPRIKKVLDTLIDGTLDDGGSGMFRDLYTSLIDGAHWHHPDHYFILLDLIPYCDAKLRCNADYSDKKAFTRKCFMNMANSGKFSSDRTIKEYASEIWGV